MKGNNDTDGVTLEDLRFSVDTVMRYFSEVGRRSKCPLCPHEGNWLFHTEDEDRDTVRIHAVGRPNPSTQYTPVALVECPQCGFVTQVNLLSVRDHFRGHRNG